MARQPDPLSEIVREGEHLAKQRRIRNTEKDLDDLRQSVRRLVGEWEKRVKLDRARAALADTIGQKRAHRRIDGDADIFQQCADELSALIDGKGESDAS